MHFITQSMLLKALGWSLLNSFWQMAILWLLYALITGMGKRFSAATRHGLALVFAGLGSIWFLSTCWAAIAGYGSVYDGMTNWRSNDFLLKRIYWIRDLFNILVPYLAILYLGSLCFLIFPYIQQHRRLRALRMEGLQKMPAPLRLFAQSIASRMGIRRKVQLWLSSLVDSPLTVGFLKPIILIPIATINQLSLEQVEAVLLHELAHIKRNDYLINLLVSWMGILFFFNPFCRLLIQTIRKEREHCCDDLVIQFRYNPHVYASALLSLERSRGHHAALAMAAIGRSQQLLLERIRRFTGHPRRRSGVNVKITAFFLINLMVCPSLFFQPRPVVKPMEMAVNAPANLENLPKTLVSNILPPTPTVSQNSRFSKQKNKIGKKHSDQLGTSESFITWVSEDEQKDQPPTAAVASSDVLSDDRDFSITAGSGLSASTPINTLTYSFPYVPSTSFVIQEAVDTSNPGYQILATPDPDARESMEKALLALNEINWKQLEKNISSPGKKMNAEILRREVSRALLRADWDKINGQLSGMESNASIKCLVENIQLQTEALRKMHVQTKPAALQLKLKIKENQLKLQQETIKKEIQFIQKQSETLNRGKKIVYI